MFRRSALALTLLAIALLGAASADTPAEWANKHMPELIEIYRDFHRHPEISFQEEQTAARVARLWKDAGVEVHTGVGGHGLLFGFVCGTGHDISLSCPDCTPMGQELRMLPSFITRSIQATTIVRPVKSL